MKLRTLEATYSLQHEENTLMICVDITSTAQTLAD